MLKRKQQNIPQKAPEKLWLQNSFDFVVPRSLDDCRKHLEKFDKGFFSSYDSVYLTSIDHHQIEFHICKSAGKSGSIWAVGYLQRDEAKTTRIVGKAGVPVYQVIVGPIILAVAGLIFGLILYVSKGVAVFCYIQIFFGVIAVITWGYLIWSRERLIDDLETRV